MAESEIKEKTMQRASVLAQNYLSKLESRFNGEFHHIPSGFDDLDKDLMGWLHEGHLIIIAGRPAMGKSAFAQQIAENVAAGGKTSIFFTLEMSGYELTERAISRRTGIPIPKLKTAQIEAGDFEVILSAAAEIHKLPLLVDDAGFELEALINKARLAARSLKDGGLPPLGCIVVDYLQLVVASGANRSLEVGAISTALKRLAKELKVPVIALSQLNRSLESRTDKRPVLSDLRESGNIEQDADLVMFVYRDEYYNEQTAEPGVAEIITRKNRHGQTGTTKLTFVADRVLFAGRARHD